MIRLCNNNNKGTINSFTDYFDLVYKEGAPYLTLKDGVSADAIPAKDLTGWVIYRALNPAGDSTAGYARVTISVK